MLHKVKTLLFDGFKYPYKKSNDYFELPEDSNTAKCKKAGFRAKAEVLVYKYDRKKMPKRDSKAIIHRHPYFNDGKAFAMCDYILFYQTKKNHLGVVVCNLKSDNPSNNLDQIKSGKIFSEYIYSTLKRLYPEDFKTIVYREVFFSSNPRNSIPTKFRKDDKSKMKRLYSSGDTVDIFDLDLQLNI